MHAWAELRERVAALTRDDARWSRALWDDVQDEYCKVYYITNFGQHTAAAQSRRREVRVKLNASGGERVLHP